MISFNVAGLLREPSGAIRDAHLRDRYVTLGSDVELAGPLDADLRLQRTNRGIIVRGSVRAPLRRTCARCTDAYVEDVRVEVEEEFLPSIDPVSGAPAAGTGGGGDRQPAHRRAPRDRAGLGASRRARAHRADASALPARLRWPVRRVRRPARDRRPCPRRRRDRPSAGRPGDAASGSQRLASFATPLRVRLYCGVPSHIGQGVPRGRSQAKGIQGAPG